MPKTIYETSTGNADTDLEMKPVSDTKPENVLPSELTADQVDRGGGSGRLVSFQSLSNLPNIIFQEKLHCKVSLFYKPTLHRASN